MGTRNSRPISRTSSYGAARGQRPSRSRKWRWLRPRVETVEPRILLSPGVVSSSRNKAHAALLAVRAVPAHAPAPLSHTAVKTVRTTRPVAVPADTSHLVPGQPGTMTTVTFTLAARNTPFHDEFGLFLVDDPSGWIGKLRPGDRGYTAAALQRRQVVFNCNQNAGAVVALQLPAGRYFGTYLIQNDTSGEFLARNPENLCKDAPKAFFSFPAANPLHSTQVIQVGPNLSGWDDRIHERNRDFHDEVVGIQVNNQPPVVTIATPTEGLLTRTEATVSGTVTDDLSGVKTLQGWLDAGPHFNVPFDASGHFQFATSLPTDGSADGRHVVTLQATDNAGNISSPATVSFVLDTTPPKLTQTLPGPLPGTAGLTDKNPTIAGVVTDAIAGVQQLQARIDGGPYFNVPFDAQGNFSFTTMLPTNGTADGTHSVFYRSTDKLGNAFTDLPGPSFTLDTTAPVVTVTSPTGSPLTNQNLTISGHVTDNLSGVQSLKAQLDGGAFFDVPVDGSGDFSLPTTLPLNGRADGSHTYEFQATDKAGNVSSPASASFTLDATPPVIALTNPGVSLTTNANITLNGTVTDNLSGVDSLNAQVDGQTAVPVSFGPGGAFQFTTAFPLNGTVDGLHTITFNALDKAGNSAIPAGLTLTLDTTGPSIVITSPQEGSLHNVNVTVAGLVTDQTSGVASLAAQLDGGSFFPVSFDASSGAYSFVTQLSTDGTADGTHTVNLQATDRAGNVSALAGVSFILDTTAPVITVTQPTGSPLTNQNLTISGHVTDNLSGVASLTAQVDGQPAVPVSFDPAGAFQFTTAFPLNGTVDGLHAITFHALDKAGNTAVPASLTLTLDTTGPSIVITSPQEGSLHNVNVTVAGLVTDQTSGVTSLVAQLDSGSFFPVSFDASSGAYSFVTQLSTDGTADGTHTVNLQATDKAGNVSPLAGVSFILDTTAPVITVTQPTGAPLTNQNLTISGHVTDNLSGVQSLKAELDGGAFFDVPVDRSGNFSLPTTLPLDGSADGSHTYQFQATDKAGNVSPLVPASFTLDATPPVISLANPGVNVTTNANITLNGTVTDNLSGVASLTAQVDGQTAVPVSFGPGGAFQFTTAFPLNGTVDGLHTITFNALDKAGNSAIPAGLTLTLDTTGPSIVITSPQEGSLHNVNVT